jgi:hypothetical protein
VKIACAAAAVGGDVDDMMIVLIISRLLCSVARRITSNRRSPFGVRR